MLVKDKGGGSKSTQGECSLDEDLDEDLIPVQGARQEGLEVKRLTTTQL